ncbi:element excision factor XisH family protein [Xanthocytophaga flava]|uniref:element excision factor XisH family protein n=1 Tax=Xanthocytophaga flava TaxID=3048013 RepID=UPI0028D03309|nr:element excision factor XisH family protein [Xanthocytophaga flavus]MDJ1471015.1 element excision factor XisH family protein [Xanthocytophaga flavus]
MSRYDSTHKIVVRALQKDGWKILKENYNLKPTKKVTFIVDILAEKDTNTKEVEGNIFL